MTTHPAEEEMTAKLPPATNRVQDFFRRTRQEIRGLLDQQAYEMDCQEFENYSPSQDNLSPLESCKDNKECRP